MKRFLAFVFGMFFGIFALFAGLGIAGYVFVSKTSLETYVPNSQGLGDLAQLSILDAYNEISKMLAEENITNPNTEGEYFSVADFEEKYNADLSVLFGFTLTDNIKEMPLFTLFTEDGVNKALDQTSVAGALDVAAMLGLTFNADLVAEMQKHSMSELLGENPLGVLDNVPLKWIATGFDSSESQLMTALGNTPVGPLANGAMGGNLLLAIKTDDKLSPISNIVLAEVLSGAAEGEVDLVGNVLGDTTLGELISDTGDLAVNSVLVNLYVGTLLNYVRTEYTLTGEETSLVEDKVVLAGANTYKFDGEGWYLAGCDCEEAHTHTETCYDFVWKNGTEEVSKLYAVLSNLKVEELAGGDFNITALLDDITLGDVMGDSIVGSAFEGLKDTAISQLPSEFENMTIGELLGDQIDGTVLEGFADKTINEMVSSLDTAPIGKFLGYELTAEVDVADYQVRGNLAYKAGVGGAKKVGTTWHDAYKLCSHTSFDECTSKCYTVWVEGSAWVEGVNSLLADKTISEIKTNGIGSLVNDLTLRDVMGDDVDDNTILAALADEPIGNISNKVNTLTLRQLLGDQVDTNNVLKLLANSTTQTLAADLNNLYLGQVLGYTRNATDTGWVEEVKGATATLANMKVGSLDKDTITNAINGLKLNEILSETEIASNNILKAIADKTISEIPTAISDMKLGVVLDLNYHDGKWYDNVTGLQTTPFNQKIADLTVGQLHGDTIASIVHELTMGDLIDSGFFEVHYGEQIDQDLLFRAQYDTTFTYTSGDWKKMTITQLIDALFEWEYVPTP
ncbi:MAG: hypothetical protein IKC47_04540 [Clostridia bacterium]|nr:hypothetical protein [Clostridia bacterium]